MSIAEVIISIFVIAATLFVVVTAVALWRAPNALTRANLMGPAIGVALPLLIIAKLLRDWSTVGFSFADLIRAIIAITSLLVVVSVASYYIARSVHGIEHDDIAIDPPRKGLVRQFGDMDGSNLLQAGVVADSKRDKAVHAAAQALRHHAGLSHRQKKKLQRGHQDHVGPFLKERHPNAD